MSSRNALTKVGPSATNIAPQPTPLSKFPTNPTPTKQPAITTPNRQSTKPTSIPHSNTLTPGLLTNHSQIPETETEYSLPTLSQTPNRNVIGLSNTPTRKTITASSVTPNRKTILANGITNHTPSHTPNRQSLYTPSKRSTISGPAVPQSGSKRTSHQTQATQQQAQESISTFVRIRPQPPNKQHIPLSNMQITGNTITIPVTDGQGTPLKRQSKVLTFDSVLSESTEQHQVYDTIVGHSLHEMLVKGQSMCLLAYGQSGTGKTHSTMGTYTLSDTGNLHPNAGLVPRTLKDLFDFVGRMNTDSIGAQYSVRMTMIEMMDRQFKDLLIENPPSIPSSEATHKLPALSKPIKSLTDAFDRLIGALKRRETASTAQNQQSSRTHALISLHLYLGQDAVTGIHIFDLAGSERFNADSDTKDRGNQINLSLLSFLRVIQAKCEGTFNPGRDSSVSHIFTLCWDERLRDTSPQTKLNFVGCINLEQGNLQTTRGTLDYTEKVKNFKLAEKKIDLVELNKRIARALTIRVEIIRLAVDLGLHDTQVEICNRFENYSDDAMRADWAGFELTKQEYLAHIKSLCHSARSPVLTGRSDDMHKLPELELALQHAHRKREELQGEYDSLQQRLESALETEDKYHMLQDQLHSMQEEHKVLQKELKKRSQVFLAGYRYHHNMINDIWKQVDSEFEAHVVKCEVEYHEKLLFRERDLKQQFDRRSRLILFSLGATIQSLKQERRHQRALTLKVDALNTQLLECQEQCDSLLELKDISSQTIECLQHEADELNAKLQDLSEANQDSEEALSELEQESLARRQEIERLTQKLARFEELQCVAQEFTELESKHVELIEEYNKCQEQLESLETKLTASMTKYEQTDSTLKQGVKSISRVSKILNHTSTAFTKSTDTLHNAFLQLATAFGSDAYAAELKTSIPDLQQIIVENTENYREEYGQLEFERSDLPTPLVQHEKIFFDATNVLDYVYESSQYLSAKIIEIAENAQADFEEFDQMSLELDSMREKTQLLEKQLETGKSRYFKDVGEKDEQLAILQTDLHFTHLAVILAQQQAVNALKEKAALREQLDAMKASQDGQDQAAAQKAELIAKLEQTNNDLAFYAERAAEFEAQLKGKGLVQAELMAAKLSLEQNIMKLHAITEQLEASKATQHNLVQQLEIESVKAYELQQLIEVKDRQIVQYQSDVQFHQDQQIDLKDEIIQVKSQLESTKHEHSALQSQFDQLDHQYTLQSDELCELEHIRQENEAEIQSIRVEFNIFQESSLIELNTKYEECNQMLEKRYAELYASRMHAHNEVTMGLEQEIFTLEQQLSYVQSELDLASEKVATQHREISDLHLQLHDTELATSTKLEMISKQFDSFLADKDDSIKQQDETIKRQDQTIKQQDEIIQQQDALIKQKDDTIKNQDAQIQEYIQEMIAFKAQYGSSIAENKAAQDSIAASAAAKEAELNEIITQLKAQLEQQTSLSASTLADHQEVATQRLVQIDQHVETILAQTIVIERRDATIAEQLTSVDQHAATISEQLSLIEQCDAMIAEQKSTLGQNSLIIAEHKVTIQNHEATIAEQLVVIEQRDRAVVETEIRIIQLETFLVEKDAIIAEQKTTISQQSEMICQKDTMIDEMQSNLVQMQSKVDSSEANIAEKSALIAEKSALIAEKDSIISGKEATVVQQQTTIDNLNTQTASTGEQLATLTTSLEKLARESKALAETVTKHVETINEQCAKITAQSLIIDDQDSKLTAQATAIDEQSTQIMAQTAELAQNRSIIAQRDATIAELNTAIDNLNIAHDQARREQVQGSAETVQELAQCNAKLFATNATIERLDAELVAMRDISESGRSQLTQTKEQLDKANDKVQLLEIQLLSHSTQIDEALFRECGISTQLAAAQETIEQLETQLDELKFKFEASSLAAETAQSRVSNMEEIIATLETSYKEAVTSVEKSSTQFESFQQQVGELQDKLASSERLSSQALESMILERDELLVKIEALNSDLIETSSQLNQARRELILSKEQLGADLAQVKSDKAQMEQSFKIKYDEEIAELSSLFQRINQENSDCTQQNNQLIDELKMVQSLVDSLEIQLAAAKGSRFRR